MRYQLNNKYLSVEFDTSGGGIVSIKDEDNIEYLWQGDSTYWTGQSPVMFPICGSLRNNEAIVGQSRTCSMVRHGIVRKLEFELRSKTDSSILFAIQSNDKLMSEYPYDFELQIKYALINKTIRTEYTVINKNDRVMPFFIGGHPGFNCPLLPNEDFEDYIIQFEKPEYAACPESIPSTGLVNVENRILYLDHEDKLPLKHSYFDVDALIFDQLQSRSVKLINPKTGKGIREDFSDFDYFILWSSNNQGPFVALEPWTGISTCNDESDIFEEKRDVKMLEPYESTSLSYDITILS